MQKLLAALSIPAVLLTVIMAAVPAHARRGGGSDFMNSPGYQRALVEGRKAYRDQYLQQQPAYEPRKRRYRRR